MKKKDNVLKENSVFKPVADETQHPDLDDMEDERDKDLFEILQGLTGGETDFARGNGDENAEKEDDKKPNIADKEIFGDTLGVYFKSMGNISVLTKSEEVALAQKIQQGKEALKIIHCFPLTKRIKQMVRKDSAGKKESYIKEQRVTRDKITEMVMEIIGELAEQWQKLTREGDNKARAELAKTIKKEIGVKANELEEFYKKITETIQSVKGAENEMIRRNLRLVVNVAKKYLYRSLPLLDLIQEGNIGLMTAVEKFDYKKGFKFSTYATWWIRQAVTRAIIDQGHTIRPPVHMAELFYKIEKAEAELFQNFGRQPTAEEVAQKLDLPVQKVEDAIKSRKIVASCSLNTPMRDDDKRELGDFVSDKDALLPSDEAEQKVDAAYLELVLSASLEPEEAKVLKMRFGLGDAGRKHTLEEIGQQMFVTRERIRQIQVKALKKLSHPARKKLLKFLND